MALPAPPDCSNTMVSCNGSVKWSTSSRNGYRSSLKWSTSSKNGYCSSFWGTAHSICGFFHPFSISNRAFIFTVAKPSPSCSCSMEKPRFSASLDASSCENGACSSRHCSLPFLLGIYSDFSVALAPPSDAFSSKTSTRLPGGVITFRSPGRWVCFGGGPRPKRPRIWKTRQRRGSVSKSQKLLDHVRSLSDVKEEVYGALDAYIAWELEFPLVAVKKALFQLKLERAWKRIIQISKWMIGKGQGKTLGTYMLLLEAFNHEGRVEEAQELWERVLTKNLGHTPRSFFQLMIFMFDRHQMYDELLEVFADMEELDVKPTSVIVNKVALVYEKLGIFDKAEKVKKKYPPPTVRHRTTNGKIIKFPVNLTIQHERRSSRENSYDSFASEDTIEHAKEHNFDLTTNEEEGIHTGSAEAVTAEVGFVQSQS